MFLPGVSAASGSKFAEGIFTKLMDELKGMSKPAAGAAGLITGLGFIFIMDQMLDCSGTANTLIGVGTGICLTLLALPGPQTQNILRKIAKICDMFTVAIQFLMMMMKLKSMMNTYQACQLQAEAQLSSRKKDGETGYDRANRIGDYYKTLDGCYQGLDRRVRGFMSDWAQFSSGVGAAVGVSRTGIDAMPKPPYTFTPKSGDLTITYDFPGHQSSGGNYGQIGMSIKYNWQKKGGGKIGGDYQSGVIPLTQISGTVKCDVKSHGLICRDTASGGKMDLTATICQTSDSVSRADCDNAKLEGDITLSWRPCDSGCLYYYDFESQFKP